MAASIRSSRSGERSVSVWMDHGRSTTVQRMNGSSRVLSPPETDFSLAWGRSYPNETSEQTSYQQQPEPGNAGDKDGQ